MDFDLRPWCELRGQALVMLWKKRAGLNRRGFEHAPCLIRYRGLLIALRAPTLMKRSTVFQRIEQTVDPGYCPTWGQSNAFRLTHAANLSFSSASSGLSWSPKRAWARPRLPRWPNQPSWKSSG